MDKSKDPTEWLKRAKSSLIMSKKEIEEGLFLEDLCFHTQQSVEKALKGLIIHLGLDLFKTHNIRVLLKELEKRITIPKLISEAIKLNQYAVLTRYPDDYYEITEEEYYEAVKIAENVYNWVADNIK